MSEPQGLRAIFKKWGWDVSTNAAGTLLASAIAAVILAAVSFIQPLNQWLFGLVYLWGWALVGLVVVGAICGFSVARYRYRKVMADTASSPFSSAAVPRNAAPFHPNDLESRVLRLLRIADGKWASFGLMARQLAVSSQQDLRQALRRLEAESWIEGHRDNYISKEDAQSFRLADAGITYARANGFQTLTEIEREEAAKK